MLRASSEPSAATRSTWAMTMPPELRAATASARFSSTSDSRSVLMLPFGSAVVPRIRATLIGNVR